MQAHPEPGVEVALNHHRRFGVEHRAARQAALDGVEYDGGVKPGFLRQHQRLAHGGYVDCHDNLVGELGGVARAVVAAVGCAAHRLEHAHILVVHGLLAADHNGERSGDSARLAAADGRVQEVHALRLAGGGDALRRGRGYGTHINDHRACLRAL